MNIYIGVIFFNKYEIWNEIFVFFNILILWVLIDGFVCLWKIYEILFINMSIYELWFLIVFIDELWIVCCEFYWFYVFVVFLEWVNIS